MKKEKFYRNLIYEFETESHTWNRSLIFCDRTGSLGSRDILTAFHIPEDVEKMKIEYYCEESGYGSDFTTWREKEEKLEDILSQSKVIPRNTEMLHPGFKRVTLFYPFMHGISWKIDVTFYSAIGNIFYLEVLKYCGDVDYEVEMVYNKDGIAINYGDALMYIPDLNYDDYIDETVWGCLVGIDATNKKKLKTVRRKEKLKMASIGEYDISTLIGVFNTLYNSRPKVIPR